MPAIVFLLFPLGFLGLDDRLRTVPDGRSPSPEAVVVLPPAFDGPAVLAALELAVDDVPIAVRLYRDMRSNRRPVTSTATTTAGNLSLVKFH